LAVFLSGLARLESVSSPFLVDFAHVGSFASAQSSVCSEALLMIADFGHFDVFLWLGETSCIGEPGLTTPNRTPKTHGLDHQSMATLDVTQLWIIREPQLSWNMTLDIEDH
jgi:hypothetical protein